MTRTLRAAALIALGLALAAPPLMADADPADRRLGSFSVDKTTVAAAIAKLSKASGVPIELAPGVEKAMAAELAKPIQMVLRSTTVGRVLDILLMGSKMTAVSKGGKIVIRLVDGPVGDGIGEGIAKADEAPDAVLVATFRQRDRISYSGTEGAVYWFEITAVKRFDRSKAALPEGDAKSYASSFAELKKRSLTLDRYHLLEVPLTYRGAGALAKAKLARLDRLLEVGRSYIVATSTTVVFSPMLGTVRPKKWGQVPGLGTHVFPFSDEALRGIDARFVAARKAHPKEEPVFGAEPAERPSPPGRPGK